MFWKKWIMDIKEKTSDMDKKDTCSYIAAYYWPHIAGCIFMIALILLFGGHYLFGNKKPAFTCVIVNQKNDAGRDRRMAESYAEEAGLGSEEVRVDSDYIFSYGDVQIQGVNESSYEKFFFQWKNKEVDAVIMPESFYRYVKEMGGEFRSIEDTGGFEAYMDGEICTAAVLGADSGPNQESWQIEEKLLLAFPSNGKHKDEADKFRIYLEHVKNGKTGGISYEEIINGSSVF